MTKPAAHIPTVCWVAQRAFDLTNPAQPITDILLTTPERLAAVLFALTILVLILNAARAKRQANAS
jgi:hypothetical protein